MDRKHSAEKMEEKKVRVRSGSMGVLEEMWKRKRERKGGGADEEGKEIFRESKKTPRSPVEAKNMDTGGESGEWRQEMREIMKDLKEDVIRWKDERRKQNNTASREMEEMQKELKELREREISWQEERSEMNGRMEELVKK